MKKPPIYFVIQTSNLGGMEQSTMQIMIEMIRRGYSVSLFSITPMGALKIKLDAAHIPYYDNHYRGRFGLFSLPLLCWKLWRLPQGTIIAVGHNLSLFLALFFQWHRAPLLSIHYHHEGVMSKWSWRVVYLLAWMRFDKIRFVSQFSLNEVLEIAPWIKNKGVVVSNIFKLPDPKGALSERRAFRARLGIPENAFVVGNAGWLIPRKRWDVFLETAANVLKIRNAHFVVVGDGPERSRLEEKVNTIPNGKKIVHFTGWLNDLSDFYNGIDLLLFNSDFDSLGRTPLEAMSYGKFVVASICKGGLVEIFPEEAGILLSEHDCHKLTEAVLGYASYFDKNNDLVNQVGVQFIKNFLSPEKIGDEFLSILNSVESADR